MKAGKKITADMVRSLPNKFRGAQVDRYLILSSEPEYVLPSEKQEIESLVSKIRRETGCEVIVNGLNRSLWYYLRLLANPNCFLERYTQQIQTDADVKAEHQALWANLLAGVIDQTSS